MSTIEHFSSCGTSHYVVVKTQELTLQEIFSALLNFVTSDEKAAYPDPPEVVRF